MTLASWLSLVAICCLGALSPGPSLAVVLRQTINNDALHGMITGVSHAFGVGLWAVLTVLGLGVLVSQSPLLYNILTYAGAGYLAWMGVRALTAPAAAHQTLAKGKSSLLTAARDGLMVSLLNPKLAIFFIALFSQYVSEQQALFDQVVMISTVTLIDGCWYVLVAALLARSGLVEVLENKSQVINKVSGVIFLGLALRVVTL